MMKSDSLNVHNRNARDEGMYICGHTILEGSCIQGCFPISKRKTWISFCAGLLAWDDNSSDLNNVLCFC